MPTHDFRIIRILDMRITYGFDFDRSCCESGAVTPLGDTYFTLQRRQLYGVYSIEAAAPRFINFISVRLGVLQLKLVSTNVHVGSASYSRGDVSYNVYIGSASYSLGEVSYTIAATFTDKLNKEVIWTRGRVAYFERDTHMWPSVSFVIETGMFLWTFRPLISGGPLLSLLCSARVHHCLCSLVRVVDWCVSRLVRLICCRIILTASGPGRLLIYRSLVIHLLVLPPLRLGRVRWGVSC